MAKKGRYGLATGQSTALIVDWFQDEQKANELMGTLLTTFKKQGPVVIFPPRGVVCTTVMKGSVGLTLACVHLSGGRYDDKYFATLPGCKRDIIECALAFKPDIVGGDFNSPRPSLLGTNMREQLLTYIIGSVFDLYKMMKNDHNLNDTTLRRVFADYYFGGHDCLAKENYTVSAKSTGDFEKPTDIVAANCVDYLYKKPGNEIEVIKVERIPDAIPFYDLIEAPGNMRRFRNDMNLNVLNEINSVPTIDLKGEPPQPKISTIRIIEDMKQKSSLSNDSFVALLKSQGFGTKWQKVKNVDINSTLHDELRLEGAAPYEKNAQLAESLRAKLEERDYNKSIVMDQALFENFSVDEFVGKYFMINKDTYYELDYGDTFRILMASAAGTDHLPMQVRYKKGEQTFDVMTLNVQFFLLNVDILKEVVSKSKAEVILVQESWFLNEQTNAGQTITVIKNDGKKSMTLEEVTTHVFEGYDMIGQVQCEEKQSPPDLSPDEKDRLNAYVGNKANLANSIYMKKNSGLTAVPPSLPNQKIQELRNKERGESNDSLPFLNIPYKLNVTV